jgi:hypothetical protein
LLLMIKLKRKTNGGDGNEVKDLREWKEDRRDLRKKTFFASHENNGG